MLNRRLAVMLGLSLLASATPAPAADIGQVMTDAQYNLMNGQVLTGDKLRGMVVVVTYWGPDCKVCDEQLKLLDGYYRQRKQMGMVAMVATVDQISPADFRSALRGYWLHGVKKMRADLDPLGSIPTTYIIDRAGQLRMARSGFLNLDELNEQLVPLLRQPQP